MIAVSKEEKDRIIQRFPNTFIVRTMKQRSKRHRYYCEETKAAMQLIKQMRDGEACAAYDRRDTGNAFRQKRI